MEQMRFMQVLFCTLFFDSYKLNNIQIGGSVLLLNGIRRGNLFRIKIADVHVNGCDGDAQNICTELNCIFNLEDTGIIQAAHNFLPLELVGNLRITHDGIPHFCDGLCQGGFIAVIIRDLQGQCGVVQITGHDKTADYIIKRDVKAVIDAEHTDQAVLFADNTHGSGLVLSAVSTNTEADGDREVTVLYAKLQLLNGDIGGIRDCAVFCSAAGEASVDDFSNEIVTGAKAVHNELISVTKVSAEAADHGAVGIEYISVRVAERNVDILCGFSHIKTPFRYIII